MECAHTSQPARSQLGKQDVFMVGAPADHQQQRKRRVDRQQSVANSSQPGPTRVSDESITIHGMDSTPASAPTSSHSKPAGLPAWPSSGDTPTSKRRKAATQSIDTNRLSDEWGKLDGCLQQTVLIDMSSDASKAEQRCEELLTEVVGSELVEELLSEDLLRISGNSGKGLDELRSSGEMLEAFLMRCSGGSE